MISLTRIFLSCVLFSTIQLADAKAMPIDPTSDGVQFGGLPNHKPGLKLRFTQPFFEMLKKDLAQYGLAYLNWDLDIPRSGIYPVRQFPIYTDVHYWNLQSTPLKFDMTSAQMNFTHMAIDEAAVVYFEPPTLKSWNLLFDYMFKILRTQEGNMELMFKDAGCLVTTELFATHDGHLYPHIHDFEISINKAKLKTSDAGKTFVYRQFFDLAKYTFEAAYNLFGATFINRNLWSYVAEQTNHQMYHFNITIPQLEREANFNLNWRLTDNPKIHDHEIDFSFFFDIGPDLKHCMQPADTHDYYFQDNYKSKYLQFVLSDRVPNCLMEAMARQKMFHFKIDTEFLKTHLGSSGFKINAALFKKSYPLIAEKYGDDQELWVFIEFHLPKIQFGMTDHDMTGQAMIKYGIHVAGEYANIIYDEFDLFVECDIDVVQEVLLAEVHQLTVKKAAYNDNGRTLPLYNTLDMTEAQYAAYWQTVDATAKRWMDFINKKILISGVPLPYWNLEFLTAFTFHPHAMLCVLDIFYNSVEEIGI